jgi:hypothetical protein
MLPRLRNEPEIKQLFTRTYSFYACYMKLLAGSDALCVETSFTIYYGYSWGYE